MRQCVSGSISNGMSKLNKALFASPRVLYHHSQAPPEVALLAVWQELYLCRLRSVARAFPYHARKPGLPPLTRDPAQAFGPSSSVLLALKCAKIPGENIGALGRATPCHNHAPADLGAYSFLFERGPPTRPHQV